MIREFHFKEEKKEEQRSHFQKEQQEQFKQKEKLHSEEQQKAQPASKEEKEPTYYDLLNISPSSSMETIKKAYHQKLKEYHPDKHQGSDFEWVRDQAHRMTQELQRAYETLSDAKKRRYYDEMHLK